MSSKPSNPLAALVVAVSFLGATVAHAGPYTSAVLFGDSRKKK